MSHTPPLPPLLPVKSSQVKSSQVTASLVITGVITYNVTRFGYDTNKEILLYSKAYYTQKQRKHFGPEQVCSFLECPAKAYPYHSNDKTLLYTYRCESGLSLNTGWLCTCSNIDFGSFLTKKLADCSFKF